MRRGRDPGGRVHRWFRRLLLPADFRARHGAEMGQVWAEARRGRRSKRGRVRMWANEVWDLARTGSRLRRERRRHGHAFVARKRGGSGGGRGLGWMDDLRYARRSLIRRPAFTAFAAGTVALGIGAVTAIYSTLEAVVLRPVPYATADRMVTLMRPIGNTGSMRAPAPEQVAAWAAMDDVFEAVEASAVRTMTLTGRGEPIRLDVGLIRPTWHAFSGRAPLLGRTFTEAETATDARVVMLSHALWEGRFGGDPEVLGRIVELDGGRWEVVGVMPPRSPLVSFGLTSVDVWRPLAPGTVTSPPVGVLREEVTLARALERLEAPVELADGTSAPGTGRGLVASLADRMRDTVMLLMAAVVALLLIACVNVSNLLLGRAERRRRETAVRSALGGSGMRLGRQMVAEGLLLGLLGGAGGVGLTLLGLGALRSLRPPGLEILDGVVIEARILGFAFLVTLLASILFSLVPVVQAARQASVDALRAGARSAGSGALGARVRWGFVSAEVALSFALVAGAVLVLGALGARLDRGAGFEADRVVVLEVDLPSWRHDDPGLREALLRRIEGRLDALGGVARVARGVGMPGAAGLTFGTVEVPGEDFGDETFTLHGPPVGPGYFETLGQPLLRGRGFTEPELRDGSPVVVLGEGAAQRFFGRIDVVGERLRLGGGETWHTVVGVTVDVPMTGLSTSERRLQMYWPNRPTYAAGGTFFLRMVEGADPVTVLAEGRQVVREAAGVVHFGETATLDTVLASTLGRERFASTLLTTFAALALVLAAVGLYGVVSQLVAQRTREIGIRMALGADGSRVGILVLRRGLGATAVGLLVGAVLATVGLDVLASRFFGLDGPRLTAFGGAAVVLSAVTAVASWAPTRRALRVDPTRAMRTE